MLTEQLAASSVTFRDEPLERALQRLREQGFARLDLTAIRHYADHFDPLKVDVGEEECLRVRDLITRYDMQAVSITSYPANPLARDINGDDWTSGVDAYIRLGLHLQSRFIIYPPGSPAPSPDHWRGTVEHVKPWLREACVRTETAHMLPAIALQSQSVLQFSQQGIDFLRILGDPQAGLAVDPAHLAAMGEDPVEAIQRMGKSVLFVVLRDTDGRNYNLPPGSGMLDYPGIMTALDDIGYQGPLVLAIDDVTLPPEQRAQWLCQGRKYLEGMSTGRKAA